MKTNYNYMNIYIHIYKYIYTYINIYNIQKYIHIYKYICIVKDEKEPLIILSYITVM